MKTLREAAALLNFAAYEIYGFGFSSCYDGSPEKLLACLVQTAKRLVGGGYAPQAKLRAAEIFLAADTDAQLRAVTRLLLGD